MKDIISGIFKKISWEKDSIMDELKIEYISFSTLDPIGRVFKYKGEIYRGIYKEKVGYVKELLNSGLFKELIAKGLLVETKVTKLTTKTFPLILKHEWLTTTFPTEWTSEMLKDSAKLIIVVNRICTKHGYVLGDAHPYNILFKGVKPVWIDFGSIHYKVDGWPAFSEFINYTVVPLKYLQLGELYEGYSILQSERTFKISSKDFRSTFLYRNFLAMVDENEKSIQKIETVVTEGWIDLKCKNIDKNKTYWSDYQKDIDDLKSFSLEFKGNPFIRFFMVIRLIKKYSCDAKTLVDLAGNNGLFSVISLKKLNYLRKIINIDYDYYSIGKSYEYFKGLKSKKLETYLLNFMLPMHSGVYNNFKSDIVLALAVTHHLLLTQGFKVDEVFEKIGSFSSKYVYIEFMPLGMWGGDKKIKPEVPEWYTQTFFEDAFKKQFKLISVQTIETHVINGVTEPHRVLFIGEIK